MDNGSKKGGGAVDGQNKTQMKLSIRRTSTAFSPVKRKEVKSPVSRPGLPSETEFKGVLGGKGQGWKRGK